jgi:hypothetical protein
LSWMDTLSIVRMGYGYPDRLFLGAWRRLHIAVNKTHTKSFIIQQYKAALLGKPGQPAKWKFGHTPLVVTNKLEGIKPCQKQTCLSLIPQHSKQSDKRKSCERPMPFIHSHPYVKDAMSVRLYGCTNPYPWKQIYGSSSAASERLSTCYRRSRTIVIATR